MDEAELRGERERWSKLSDIANEAGEQMAVSLAQSMLRAIDRAIARL